MDNESIRSVSLTIESDGYYRLHYRVGSGQMVASLGTYHESDVRADLEMTKELEPQMVVLAAIDHRKRRTKMEWYQ